MDDQFVTKKLKYASLKKILQKNSSGSNCGTIDSLHSKFTDDFAKQNNDIPKLSAKCEKLKIELAKLEAMPPKKFTIADIAKKADLKNKIENINEQIEKLNTFSDELDYYAKNMETLTQYYGNSRSVNSNKLSIQTQEIKDLSDLFSANKKQIPETSILDDFLRSNCSKYTKKKSFPIQLCPECKIEKVLQPSDGNLVCMNCGHSDQIIVDLEKINFKDPYYENKSTGYKRMNHFSELLNQFQAKESTEISNEIYASIVIEIKKRQIKDPKLLTKRLMRAILKKLELNQYFEHIPFIVNRLTSLDPPTISRETEEKLKNMFREIQMSFKMFKPKSKKNFLNYNYVFRKFFELLNLDHFLHHFPLLKSPTKVREHDDLWEKICNNLHWEYIPSS